MESMVQLRPWCFSKEAAELWALYCLRPQPRFGQAQQDDGFVSSAGLLHISPSMGQRRSLAIIFRSHEIQA